jgi:hypothetical protein
LPWLIIAAFELEIPMPVFAQKSEKLASKTHSNTAHRPNPVQNPTRAVPAISPQLPLTAERVLSLQQTHGNRFVQQMVNSRRKSASREISSTTDESVQRAIFIQGVGGRMKEVKNPAVILGKIKNAAPDVYKFLTDIGMADQDISTEIQAFIDSSSDYTLAQVNSGLQRIAENRVATDPLNQRQTTVGAVELTITSLGTNVVPGLEIVENGATITSRAKGANFRANVLVKGPEAEVGTWQVGFVQTILSAHRDIYYQTSDGLTRVTSIDVPNPMRDSSRGYAGPWLNNMTYTGLDAKEIASATVSMEDQPSVTWTAKTGEVLQQIIGRDTFKAWLIMRKSDGSDVRFLHLWEWHADYGHSQDMAGVLGTRFDGESPDTTGAGAVLGGAPALDSYTVQDRLVPRRISDTLQVIGMLPPQDEFKTMKKKATGLTPFSGMIPTKEYGQWATRYTNFVNKREWQNAVASITWLKNALTRMLNAKGYWKSDPLKQQYFMPIYESVMVQDELATEQRRLNP